MLPLSGGSQVERISAEKAAGKKGLTNNCIVVGTTSSETTVAINLERGMLIGQHDIHAFISHWSTYRPRARL